MPDAFRSRACVAGSVSRVVLRGTCRTGNRTAIEDVQRASGAVRRLAARRDVRDDVRRRHGTAAKARPLASSTTSTRSSVASFVPAIGAAIPVIVLSVALISVLLAEARAFGLTNPQTATLVAASFGVSCLLSLLLTSVYRQPLYMTWSSTGVVFLASQATAFAYREVLGAVFVAGALVCALGALGLTARLTVLVPAPIVFGILAGLVLPYVARIFSDTSVQPLVLGSIIAAYVVSRWLLPGRVPPVLPALVVGLMVAGLRGELSWPHGAAVMPPLAVLWPVFTVKAIVTIAPVVAILMAALANLAAVVVLRAEGYQPPARTLNMAAGLATMVMACVAAAPVNLGNFVTPVIAGPDAGEHRFRHRSVYVASGALLVITPVAGVAAGIQSAVPDALLFGVAGLALVGVLAQALGEMTGGPLRFGPLFAFAVTSSSMHLAGFGAAFWALVIGMLVTLLMEREEYTALVARPEP
jgi:benzoate membrane transport protein